MTQIVEMRCPVGPQRLLGKMQLAGERPHITLDNLVELACDDCKRTLRREGGHVERVLHRYSLDGQLVETEVVS